MFFLLYKLTNDGIFYNFRPLSKDFRRFFKILSKARRTFLNIFRKFLKISEDSWRLSRKTRRCFADTPTNLSTIKETNLISVKSSISSHVKISYLHMWRYIFTCEDTVSILSICYHSVYHWLLSQYNNSDYLFSLIVSGRYPENPAIWLVPGVGSIFLSPDHGHGNGW